MSGNVLIVSLVVSLGLTLLLETGFFLAAGKFSSLVNWRNRKDLLLLLLVNILTNPVVVLSFWLLTFFAGLNRYIILAVLEVLAVLTEGCIYKKYGSDYRRPYLFSLCANAFSFGAGALLQMIV